jgi:hypothetical protein
MRTSIGITVGSRFPLLIVLILFTGACGPAVQSEDSAPAATENPAHDPAVAMSRHMAGPSGTAALTAGTTHYHVALESWIPQYWLVDPSTGGLSIPYAASLLIPNFSNCHDGGWLNPITTVYSRFVGDNHVGYDGSYRTLTAVDFDWNGSSISNYTTNYYVGTSHRVIDYSWPGGWWWSGGSTECTEARTGNVYTLPPSFAIGASFTFASTGSDSFLPPGFGLGDPLFGQLWGAFSGGNLTLTWNTGQFPSFGLQVQATGQPTYTKTVNDVWGLGSDISNPIFVPIIGAKINCWPVLCNFGSVTIAAPVGSSCAHPVCSTGVPLTSSCSSCAGAVCSRDPYCCQWYWDSICVGEVPAYCGTSCP